MALTLTVIENCCDQFVLISVVLKLVQEKQDIFSNIIKYDLSTQFTSSSVKGLFSSFITYPVYPAGRLRTQPSRLRPRNDALKAKYMKRTYNIKIQHSGYDINLSKYIRGCLHVKTRPGASLIPV